MGLADELANGNINVNVYRKRDPEKQYRGWGYALNNLLRGGFGNGGLFPQESYLPMDEQPRNYMSGLLGTGANFLADMIWGNKYDRF